MRRLDVRPILSIAVLGAAGLLAGSRTLPPPPLPASAPGADFSAERAIEHVRVIAVEPRLVGSTAFTQARDYVLGQLRDLGFTTDVQTSSILGERVENVVARLDGTHPSGALLLVAHLAGRHAPVRMLHRHARHQQYRRRLVVELPCHPPL